MSTPSAQPSGPGPEEPTRPPTAAEQEEAQERLKAVNRRESDSAWKSVAYLLTGPLVYGGLGALADHWLGTSWLVGVGIVGGMALSLYLIWFRYGTH
ncbi:AtpZ/AtpI family protein [Intrasporangium flavum]|uniref:AtpZ/AtpI family protein n=1 Tax=Intrasporangium flavum TaxID=1428657 RepID=UPI00096E4C8E|nr:AtpZ/AtpI family protein [Intrasporangium flavum]